MSDYKLLIANKIISVIKILGNYFMLVLQLIKLFIFCLSIIPGPGGELDTYLIIPRLFLLCNSDILYNKQYVALSAGYMIS